MILDHRVRLHLTRHTPDGREFEAKLKLSSQYTFATQLIVFIILVLQVFLTAFGIDPSTAAKFAPQDFGVKMGAI